MRKKQLVLIKKEKWVRFLTKTMEDYKWIKISIFKIYTILEIIFLTIRLSVGGKAKRKKKM